MKASRILFLLIFAIIIGSVYADPVAIPMAIYTGVLKIGYFFGGASLAFGVADSVGEDDNQKSWIAGILIVGVVVALVIMV
jgi:hypothetical protein